MEYISTRGGIKPIPFSQAVMMGLATDGGLLLPGRIPRVSSETLKGWQVLPYPQLALEVIDLFAGDIPREDLWGLVERAYDTFDHLQVVPLVEVGGIHIMELFHGPTLAFKDIALQFLGNLFEYLLDKAGDRMNVLGATSGDTGSAAIYGVKGRKNMAIFVLHPHGRVSPVQELQMTTVTDPGVHNIAIKGTFDDCQAIVKDIFGDLEFKGRHHLGAVNSINWARVLAQVVYYVWGYLRMREGEVSRVAFTVPTGNFGNIFAGFVARRMLPKGAVEPLALATNENDILYRFISRGDYSLGRVVSTISPSMDIQVASNFERYLYYLWDEDPARVREGMGSFKEAGRLAFTPEELKRVRRDFASMAVDQDQTLETIGRFYGDTCYILDPHTAVGVTVGLAMKEEGVPMICLATAHPAKFPDAVKGAIGKEPPKPPRIAELEGKEHRFEVLPAHVERVKAYIEDHAI
jgi:threonine synthase